MDPVIFLESETTKPRPGPFIRSNGWEVAETGANQGGAIRVVAQIGAENTLLGTMIDRPAALMRHTALMTRFPAPKAQTRPPPPNDPTAPSFGYSGFNRPVYTAENGILWGSIVSRMQCPHPQHLRHPSSGIWNGRCVFGLVRSWRWSLSRADRSVRLSLGPLCRSRRSALPSALTIPLRRYLVAAVHVLDALAGIELEAR